MEEQKIEAVLKTLTLEEKASLCSGLTSWTTKPVEGKGVPSVFMADGPTGLRKEDGQHERENGGPSVRATCFPTEATLAGSWDPQLTGAVGEAIGAECRAHGVSTLLAPGVNIKRSPLCGRNFEYYSEDPLLAGKLAVGFIRGLRRQGVGCSLKHFAANSEEMLRMSISSEVDERALHEIYLRAFEIAVKEVAPSTVMCSYNRINGVYAADNRELLTGILREKWGFEGLVMSDWGAVDDRVQGIRAGLDLEMPGSGGVNDLLILNAVKDGSLSEEELDTTVRRLLRFVFDCVERCVPAPCDYRANHALAVRALEESAVLLKNSGVLPLQEGERILFVGDMAEHPRYQGGGSSIVNARGLESPLKAARRLGYEVSFARGWPGGDEDREDESLRREAVRAAADHDKVVLFLGLTDVYECEGYDRTHLSIPPSQIALLSALRAAGKPVVAVFSGGSPVELPWLGQVDALLNLYLGGEGVGEAACRLLWGRANPCGKLAETWPMTLSDTPAYHHYPMGPRYVSYNESIFVGYRYYDTAGAKVRFPFGYGLSYTSFAYSGLSVPAAVGRGEALAVRFCVTNTGDRAGAEVCQCYLHHENPSAFKPEQELAAFAKVFLQPGETKEVTLTVPPRAFSFYSVAAQDFVVEQGRYELRVGSSSRKLPLRAAVEAAGETGLRLPAAQLASAPYGALQDNWFPDAWFETLHPLPKQENRPARRGEFNRTTPLGELAVTWPGRLMRRVAYRVGGATTHFVRSPKVNRRIVRRMTSEFPVKNIVLMSDGLIDYDTVDALLDVCNGKGGWGRLLKGLGGALKKLRRRA